MPVDASGSMAEDIYQLQTWLR